MKEGMVGAKKGSSFGPLRALEGEGGRGKLNDDKGVVKVVKMVKVSRTWERWRRERENNNNHGQVWLGLVR